MTANVSDDGGWPSLWPRRSVDDNARVGTPTEQITVDPSWAGFAAQITAAVASGEIPHDWTISDVMMLPIVTNPPIRHVIHDD